MGTQSKDDARGDARKTAEDFATNVRDSAQQIWLAGLGAFAKAQQEGGKVFETLVKEGSTMQRKTQAAAEERFAEATARMADVAADISSKASGLGGRLEGVFEERVARAMKKMGVPTTADIEELAARIDALDKKFSRRHVKPASPKAGSPGSATGAGTRSRSTSRRNG